MFISSVYFVALLGFLAFLTRDAVGQSTVTTCSGICAEGDEMLNPRTDVKIGGQFATCGFFDIDAKETTDAEECSQWQEDAAAAGCKCGEPIECSGICAEGDEMLNPRTDVKIGGILSKCSSFDMDAKETIDAEECSQWQEDAAAAGCKCGEPIECSGICAEGDEMLNPRTDVKIGGILSKCSSFDMDAKETIDAEECTQWQEDAAAAGCKCGVPIECPGICAEGDEMLNPRTDVKIGGHRASCDFYDFEAKETIDAEECTQWQEDAAAAGCKCGVPIECPGICAEGDEMLNPRTDVKIGGHRASCDFYDFEAKETIDAEECTQWQEDAAAAGCKCGVPIECPGICAEGETLVNRADDVKNCGTHATCGFFDEKNKEVIDTDVCSQNAANARVAGCNCTGEYPDDEEFDCSTSAGAGRFISTSAVVSLGVVVVGVSTGWMA